MATREEMFNSLAKHEVAEELAREWCLSPEDQARLDRHLARYRKESDLLAVRFGGAAFVPPELEDKLSEDLYAEDPGLGDVVNRLIETTTKILKAGNG